MRMRDNLKNGSVEDQSGGGRRPTNLGNAAGNMLGSASTLRPPRQSSPVAVSVPYGGGGAGGGPTSPVPIASPGSDDGGSAAAGGGRRRRNRGSVGEGVATGSSVGLASGGNDGAGGGGVSPSGMEGYEMFGDEKVKIEQKRTASQSPLNGMGSRSNSTAGASSPAGDGDLASPPAGGGEEGAAGSRRRRRQPDAPISRSGSTANIASPDDGAAAAGQGEVVSEGVAGGEKRRRRQASPMSRNASNLGSQVDFTLEELMTDDAGAGGAPRSGAASPTGENSPTAAAGSPTGLPPRQGRRDSGQITGVGGGKNSISGAPPSLPGSPSGSAIGREGTQVVIQSQQQLQAFLNEKKKELAVAHERRKVELESVMAKDRDYLAALMEEETERYEEFWESKINAQFEENDHLVKEAWTGQKDKHQRRRARAKVKRNANGVVFGDSPAEIEYRQKMEEFIKERDHIVRKLEQYHEEHRDKLNKKLVVENTRVTRTFKSFVGKFTTPSVRNTVVNMVTDYLNGEEWIKMLTLQSDYRSPDYVKRGPESINTMIIEAGIQPMVTEGEDEFEEEVAARMKDLDAAKLRRMRKNAAQAMEEAKQAEAMKHEAEMRAQESEEARLKHEAQVKREMEALRLQQERELEENRLNFELAQREAELQKKRRADLEEAEHLVKEKEHLEYMQRLEKQKEEAEAAKQRFLKEAEAQMAAEVSKMEAEKEELLRKQQQEKERAQKSMMQALKAQEMEAARQREKEELEARDRLGKELQAAREEAEGMRRRMEDEHDKMTAAQQAEREKALQQVDEARRKLEEDLRSVAEESEAARQKMEASLAAQQRKIEEDAARAKAKGEEEVRQMEADTARKMQEAKQMLKEELERAEKETKRALKALEEEKDKARLEALHEQEELKKKRDEEMAEKERSLELKRLEMKKEMAAAAEHKEAALRQEEEAKREGEEAKRKLEEELAEIREAAEEAKKELERRLLDQEEALKARQQVAADMTEARNEKYEEELQKQQEDLKKHKKELHKAKKAGEKHRLELEKRKEQAEAVRTKLEEDLQAAAEANRILLEQMQKEKELLASKQAEIAKESEEAKRQHILELEQQAEAFRLHKEEAARMLEEKQRMELEMVEAEKEMAEARRVMEEERKEQAGQLAMIREEQDRLAALREQHEASLARAELTEMGQEADRLGLTRSIRFGPDGEVISGTNTLRLESEKAARVMAEMKAKELEEQAEQAKDEAQRAKDQLSAVLKQHSVPVTVIHQRDLLIAEMNTEEEKAKRLAAEQELDELRKMKEALMKRNAAAEKKLRGAGVDNDDDEDSATYDDDGNPKKPKQPQPPPQRKGTGGGGGRKVVVVGRAGSKSAAAGSGGGGGGGTAGAGEGGDGNDDIDDADRLKLGKEHVAKALKENREISLDDLLDVQLERIRKKSSKESLEGKGADGKERSGKGPENSEEEEGSSKGKPGSGKGGVQVALGTPLRPGEGSKRKKSGKKVVPINPLDDSVAAGGAGNGGDNSGVNGGEKKKGTLGSSPSASSLPGRLGFLLPSSRHLRRRRSFPVVACELGRTNGGNDDDEVELQLMAGSGVYSAKDVAWGGAAVAAVASPGGVLQQQQPPKGILTTMRRGSNSNGGTMKRTMGAGGRKSSLSKAGGEGGGGGGGLRRRVSFGGADEVDVNALAEDMPGADNGNSGGGGGGGTGGTGGSGGGGKQQDSAGITWGALKPPAYRRDAYLDPDSASRVVLSIRNMSKRVAYLSSLPEGHKAKRLMDEEYAIIDALVAATLPPTTSPLASPLSSPFASMLASNAASPVSSPRAAVASSSTKTQPPPDANQGTLSAAAAALALSAEGGEKGEKGRGGGVSIEVPPSDSGPPTSLAVTAPVDVTGGKGKKKEDKKDKKGKKAKSDGGMLMVPPPLELSPTAATPPVSPPASATAAAGGSGDGAASSNSQPQGILAVKVLREKEAKVGIQPPVVGILIRRMSFSGVSRSTDGEHYRLRRRKATVTFAEAVAGARALDIRTALPESGAGSGEGSQSSNAGTFRTTGDDAEADQLGLLGIRPALGRKLTRVFNTTNGTHTLRRKSAVSGLATTMKIGTSAVSGFVSEVVLGKQTRGRGTRRGSGDGVDEGDDLDAAQVTKGKGAWNTLRTKAAGYVLDEHETFFHNRRRHIFEPQQMEEYASGWWIRFCAILNLVTAYFYIYWRFARSMIGVTLWVWSYTFLGAEIIMLFGLMFGHLSRSFPVHRQQIFMDDLILNDEKMSKVCVTVLIPTAGEKLWVILQAMFGVYNQRLWKSEFPKKDLLRVVVLDEKRRQTVVQLVSLVYTLAEICLEKDVRVILMDEGVSPLTPRGLYDYYCNSQHRGRTQEASRTCNVKFMRALEVVNEIDTLLASNDDVCNRFSISQQVTEVQKKARRASCFDGGTAEVQPGVERRWARRSQLPTLIYFSRVDSGMPRISPKAGNMNAALFVRSKIANEPLIGKAGIVVVNDARHELAPEFVQRTVPFFFTWDGTRNEYRWADVAFVQIPQRFPDQVRWHDPDPLGNQAATQFDIVNCGRDGVGGVLSCGQGSVWRVQVLRDGIRPDGSKFTTDGKPKEAMIGDELGFRAQVLIEDTHTSISLMKQGWRSVYLNHPGEWLAKCTMPPDNIKWRVKQVLRWHQGAVQLAVFKGWKYALSGEHWASMFQRWYALDAVSYFLQAFAGMVLLVFPIVYGFTGQSPFNAVSMEFAIYFLPFIISATLPTVAAMGWRSTSSAKVMRDEQVWFATSYVQIYGVFNVVWTKVTGKDPSDAWRATCPVWPLYLIFTVIIAAFFMNIYSWVKRGFTEPWTWVSCMGACFFALHSLWPMVSFGLGVTMPPSYYLRVFGLLVLMLLVGFWM